MIIVGSELNVQKVKVFHFSDIRKNNGFLMEAACRNSLDFCAHSLLKQLYNDYPILKNH